MHATRLAHLLKPALRIRYVPTAYVNRRQCFCGAESQDLSKLNVAELTPLTPEVISRQATINIGELAAALFWRQAGRDIMLPVPGCIPLRHPAFICRLPQSFRLCRHNWPCGAWQVHGGEGHLGRADSPF